MQEHIVGVGDTAPNFTITTSAGDQMTPRNFGGKVLVLNFWASWCAPCVEEAPSLNEFAKTLKDAGVVVLGVSVDRNEQSYLKFREALRRVVPDGARSAGKSELSLRHLQDSRELHHRSERQSGAQVRGLPERDGQAISWTDPELVRFREVAAVMQKHEWYSDTEAKSV